MFLHCGFACLSSRTRMYLNQVKPMAVYDFVSICSVAGKSQVWPELIAHLGELEIKSDNRQELRGPLMVKIGHFSVNRSEQQGKTLSGGHHQSLRCCYFHNLDDISFGATHENGVWYLHYLIWSHNNSKESYYHLLHTHGPSEA